MNWFSGIVVFVIIWWCVFFMVLPFGVRTPDQPGPGHAPSAPVKPRLWLKTGVTTLITLALWGVAYWLIEGDLISFREG